MRMAAASWMWKIRDRGLRTRNRSDEDEVQLDLSKVCPENVYEILSNICKRQGITEGRKLGYLNAFVKLLIKNKNDLNPSGYTVEEILYCLRPALANESTQVRAGCLRAVRYFIQTKQDAAICMRLQYPILIARSLDLNLMNDTERIQALRVIRHLLCLNTADFPVSLMRAVVALPAGCGDERLLNAALGTLAEICVLNPDLFIMCGGATAVLRNLSCVRSARMSEALIGVLLYLLNKPDTRQKARINLDCLAAPYTDLHTVDKIKDMVQSSDSRLKWPHVTLLSMLRSWPGALHFCHPERESLRSIVATLYLNQMGVRKAVLDLLYELLCLAQPEWSDEMSVALEAVDPSRSQDSFRLTEGFVAAEGKAVLPHLSKCRVNLSELHLALLLYCFLEAGLLDGIVEVIVSEDTFLSVRATILLGELLHLIHLLLPPECCNLTPALPNLLSYAVRGRPATSQRTPFSKHVDEQVVSRHTSPTKDVSKRNSYVLEDKRKKDCIPQNRLSVRSGHSSVRTVSESSTDKVIKVEKSNVYETTVAVGSADTKDGVVDSELKGQPEMPSTYVRSEQTTNLLHDVREALSDLTNTFNIKSQKQDQAKYKSSCTSSDNPAEVDVPYSCRSQQRALAAVSALSRLHRLLRKRPAPASIFLDHVLTSVDRKEPMDGTELAKMKGKTYGKNKVAQVLTKECEEAIKESGVLNIKDPFAWNWDIIRSVLKSRPECLRKAEDHNQRMFLRRLVQFVTPTARQFSRVEFGADRRTVNTFTLAACELIDCLLLGPEESECEKLLMELLEVMKSEFESISTSKSAHDCLLSPQNVMNSLCQDYFLLVGHLTRSEGGRKALEKAGIFKILLHLAVSTNHDCYVKLIISSLDYSAEGMTREIMSKTLSCKHTASRLYATRFLRVLLRTPLRKHPNYAAWVIELLVNQLHDEDKAISLAAINALDEACDCKEYLGAMINLRPSLLHLGDRGLLLLIRFLSVTEGFSYLSEVNFVPNQLQKWATNYNYKYVCIVEGELCDALSLYEKNEDGRYSSRLSNSKLSPGDVYVAPHLYGQLTQHEAGFNTLMCDDNICRLIQVVFMGPCSTDNEILELKAAVWALGHISSSGYGAQWARQQGITKALVNLSQKCSVYSVRATAFYALALTATNSEGADTLRTLGWHTVRHNRHDRWPVVTPLSLLEEAFFQYEEERSTNRNSVGSFDGHSDSITKSGLFFLPEDTAGESEDSLSSFPVHEKTARERKAATLPPTGIVPTYHHNRSYSESKADSDWSHVSSSGQSNSGMDMHELSDRLIQNLSPIPSSGSLVTVKSNRRGSVSSNYSTQGLCLSSQLSHQDALGYATLRSLYKGRRPFLSPSPNLSLPLTPSMQLNLSPLSPIELIAFQDWRQMSPLARPKHSENQPLCSEFEARGIRWPLFSESCVRRTLHYESSRSCITKSPDDVQGEETMNTGPCYLGICLPQRLVDLFPDEEDIPKSEILLSDNNADSTAGMDISSCDSETDTAPDIREAGDTEKSYIKEGKTVLKRRHDRNNCLLCSVSRYTNNKQPRWRKISASSVHRIRTETESSYGGIGNDGESPVILPWQTKGGLEGVNSADSSSTDMTSLAQRSLGDTFKSRSVVRREIVHLTEQLANPVLYKTCKQALLHLKQMYGDIFHDVCVYSDVSSIMANIPLRIQARRFLQELFLDAPFCELYEEPLAILNLQPTADNDETSFSLEKGTTNQGESLNNEDSLPTQDSLNWKTGIKPNVYDTEQRTNQGYELEVIIETDARSESSDMCKLGSSEEKQKDQISAAGSHDSIGKQDTVGKKHIQTFQSNELLMSNDHSDDKKTIVLEKPKEDGTPQAKVLKSRQQLREEFFATTVCSKKEDYHSKSKEERSGENSSIKTTPKIQVTKENMAKEKHTEQPKSATSMNTGKQEVSKQIMNTDKADNKIVTKKLSKVPSKTAKSHESTKESVVASSEKIESKKLKTIENSGESKVETLGSRQRKKATAKVPNRESLDVSKNRKDSMSKEEKEEKKKSRS